MTTNNGWQPIETAPRDGTPVLIAGGTLFSDSGMANDSEGEFNQLAHASLRLGTSWDIQNTCSFSSSWVENPTHWMPLPAPPASEVGNNG